MLRYIVNANLNFVLSSLSLGKRMGIMGFIFKVYYLYRIAICQLFLVISLIEKLTVTSDLYDKYFMASKHLCKLGHVDPS